MCKKICKTCEHEKSLDEFHKHKATKDGRTSSCKDCAKARAVAWNKANPERKRAAGKKWASENVERSREIKRDYYLVNKENIDTRYEQWVKNNPEKVAKYRKSWRDSNPIKCKVHWVLNHAIRKGEITKPLSCECCGVFTDTLHAHHCDYSKPLDVDWLCSLCHRDWHKHNKSING